MKSEKIQKYIDDNKCAYPMEGYVAKYTAETAVETAEQEAEERMRQMVKYKVSDGCEHITIGWRSAGDAGGYIYAISGTGVTINSQNILGWRMIHQ